MSCGAWGGGTWSGRSPGAWPRRPASPPLSGCSRSRWTCRRMTGTLQGELVPASSSTPPTTPPSPPSFPRWASSTGSSRPTAPPSSSSSCATRAPPGRQPTSSACTTTRCLHSHTPPPHRPAPAHARAAAAGHPCALQHNGRPLRRGEGDLPAHRVDAVRSDRARPPQRGAGLPRPGAVPRVSRARPGPHSSVLKPVVPADWEAECQTKEAEATVAKSKYDKVATQRTVLAMSLGVVLAAATAVVCFAMARCVAGHPRPRARAHGPLIGPTRCAACARSPRPTTTSARKPCRDAEEEVGVGGQSREAGKLSYLPTFSRQHVAGVCPEWMRATSMALLVGAAGTTMRRR